MKRYFAFILAWVAIPAAVWAQAPAAPSDRHPEAIESSAQTDPAALAMRESQRLQEALGLNVKQTKKVYKFFYKHFKKETSSSGIPGGMGPRSGMGGPGGPGGMPGGAGRQGGPGQGGPGRLAADERPQHADMNASELHEKAEAWKKQQAKKFRKIFSAEQYAVWEKMSAKPEMSRPEVPAGQHGEDKAPHPETM